MTIQRPAADNVAEFRPKYIHRVYRMSLTWARALEAKRMPDGRRVPGTARRVLEILEGAQALNMGPASQLGIVRMSRPKGSRVGGMPRSSVQDGLRALEILGLVVKGPKGWSIKLDVPLEAVAPLPESGTSKEGISSLQNPELPPCPQGGREPEGKEPKVQKLEPKLDPEREAMVELLAQAGTWRHKAREVAAVTKLDLAAVKTLAEDLADLLAAGEVDSLGALALWALRKGWTAAKRVAHWAGRIRAQQVRSGAPEATGTPRPGRDEFAAAWSAGRAQLVAVIREEVAALAPAAKRLLAMEARRKLEGFPAAWRGRVALSVWWDVLAGQGRRRRLKLAA